MGVVSESIAEATDIAADVHESKPDDVNVALAENHEVHEQLAELAKAVQGALAAEPAQAAERDTFVVYGVCLCLPQSAVHESEHAPNMNVLLLTARAGDQQSVKLTEVQGSESMETRRVLRDLLATMQRTLTTEPEEANGSSNGSNAGYEYAGANGALPHHKLSEREFQVVHMLSKGKTVGAISKELNLSVKTVSTYRVRALKKMGFKTNAELIRYMIQYKLG